MSGPSHSIRNRFVVGLLVLLPCLCPSSHSPLSSLDGFGYVYPSRWSMVRLTTIATVESGWAEDEREPRILFVYETLPDWRMAGGWVALWGPVVINQFPFQSVPSTTTGRGPFLDLFHRRLIEFYGGPGVFMCLIEYPHGPPSHWSTGLIQSLLLLLSAGRSAASMVILLLYGFTMSITPSWLHRENKSGIMPPSVCIICIFTRFVANYMGSI